MAGAGRDTLLNPVDPDISTITLDNPPFMSAPVWECIGKSPQNVDQLNSIGGTTIEVQVDEDGRVVCSNGVILTPSDVEGFYVLSPEYSQHELALLAHAVDRLSSPIAQIFPHIHQVIHMQKAKIIDVYTAAHNALRGVPIYEDRLELAIAFLQARPTPEILAQIDTAGGSAIDPNYSLGDRVIATLTDHEYATLAIAHLGIIFTANHETIMINKQNPMKIPNFTAIALYGQEMWWALHLISPRLNRKYWEVFGQYVRPGAKVGASMFTCGESFATDFWVSSGMALNAMYGVFTRWYISTFGEDTIQNELLIAKAADYFKKTSGNITNDDLCKFKRITFTVIVFHNENLLKLTAQVPIVQAIIEIFNGFRISSKITHPE